MKLLVTLSLASVVLGALIDSAAPTPSPSLEKRYQKVRLPATTTTSTSSEPPKKWVRTIYSSVPEIVTPTVIQGVTFSAKPATATDYPQPWVSLKKDGSPKTITPKIKNGRTENPSPVYSTYFQTATTVVWNYDQLKAHNMEPDQIHEEVKYIDEDKTYVSLDPLIRCTPDRYFKKGIARDSDSAPFCTPHEKEDLKMGQTYFITWYSRFFEPEVEKVRLHFMYVKETALEKGMKKRDVEDAFFTTEWLDNFHGYYPFSVQEDWLLGKPVQSVAVAVQPDTLPDEEFELMENFLKFKILKGPRIAKKNKETRRIEDMGITDDSAYYIILSIPSVVAVAALGMYFFVWINKGETDLTAIQRKVYKTRHKVLGKFTGKKNKKYSELPQYKDETKVV